MSALNREINTTTFYAGMVAPFAIVALVVPVVLLRSWVITMLWGWYIVPGFNVAPLRMSVAFGLSTIVVMLSPKRNSKKENETFGMLATDALLNQLFPLLVGWMGSFFV